MTLPFRRRHHDDETAHDRARARTASEMLEPLGDDDAGWLGGHLDECGECRQDRTAYLADRQLLRGLRDRAPEAPRDLWARTSSALDREARSRRRGAGAPGRRRAFPFGAAAGALLVVVVIGVTLVPPLTPPSGTPGRSGAAVVTPGVEPTPFEVTAGRVAWIRPAANGSWELVTADVESVCPRPALGCEPLGEGDPGRPVNLGVVPTGVTISPIDETQLVVEARGEGAQPDRILVVTVPPPTPAPTETPGGTTPEVTPATGTPTEEPASPGPSPANPDGTIEIASGVVVVGEAAYSSDGKWLAFSARPSDNSTGPDLYLWSVGSPTALPVTTDHQTYFSAWLDGMVLASRVDVPPAPAASDLPSVAPTSLAEPTADASGVPSAPPAPPVEAHPSSFLLDPATLLRIEIAQPDVWLPVVDPTRRAVAYWSGTLISTPDGLDWQLGTGSVVLDGWSDGTDAQATPDPAGGSGDPAATAPATAPATAAPAIGPAGSPVTIVPGPMAEFKAKFDPSGTRLSVWVGEQMDALVGRLHLLVLDPLTGAINPDLAPLPGTPALRRFSIALGRLAWVSPSGQDGLESAVQVLGWSRDDFGEIRTIPTKGLYIVR